MPPKAIQGNLAGTGEDEFTLGEDVDVGIGRDGAGNLTLKDKVVVGSRTLTQLLEGDDDDQVKDHVPEFSVFTVKASHRHQVFHNFTIDGEYIVDGESVIFT